MNSVRPVVHLYTDGSYRQHTDVGGWGSILVSGTSHLVLADREEDTTNQRMELAAVINALQQLFVPCTVMLYSDSKYVLDGINGNLANWKLNNWMTQKKSQVKNQDLWIALDQLMTIHDIRPIWVRGHNGHDGNEFANWLAQYMSR